MVEFQKESINQKRDIIKLRSVALEVLLSVCTHTLVWTKLRKPMYTPVNPSFTRSIKKGFQLCEMAWACYHDKVKQMG